MTTTPPTPSPKVPYPGSTPIEGAQQPDSLLAEVERRVGKALVILQN